MTPVTYGEGLPINCAAPGGVDAVSTRLQHDTPPVSIELLGGEKSRIVTIAGPDAATRNRLLRVTVEESQARRQLTAQAALR